MYNFPMIFLTVDEDKTTINKNQPKLDQIKSFTCNKDTNEMILTFDHQND